MRQVSSPLGKMNQLIAVEIGDTFVSARQAFRRSFDRLTGTEMPMVYIPVAYLNYSME